MDDCDGPAAGGGCPAPGCAAPSACGGCSVCGEAGCGKLADCIAAGSAVAPPESCWPMAGVVAGAAALPPESCRCICCCWSMSAAACVLAPARLTAALAGLIGTGPPES